MTPLQSKQPNFSLGQAGEHKAIAYLKAKDYRILDTNVQIKHQEIDIVALDPQTNELVFVEVKTRSQDYSGTPTHSVNWKKTRSLQAAAKTYCKLKKLTQDYRFDAIAILPRTVEHYENITW